MPSKRKGQGTRPDARLDPEQRVGERDFRFWRRRLRVNRGTTTHPEPPRIGAPPGIVHSQEPAALGPAEPVHGQPEHYGDSDAGADDLVASGYGSPGLGVSGPANARADSSDAAMNDNFAEDDSQGHDIQEGHDTAEVCWVRAWSAQVARNL